MHRIDPRLVVLRARLAVAAMIIATVFVNGCSRKRPAQAKPAVPVLVATAIETNMPVLVSAIGNVMPISRVTIRSQVTGQLTEVHFKEGQEVKKGDLLFTIDPRPPQAALLQAQSNVTRDQAQFDNAKVEFDRSKKLFDQKILSQEDFDNARAAMNGAQATMEADRAALTNAQLNLEYTAIRSPIDGVTGAQLVFPGNIVKSPDDEMLVINQIHPIYVQCGVPEQFLAEIRREMKDKALKVEASFNGMEGKAPQGDLTFVDNAVDTTTGTIQLKATFANENSALWPGQFVQISLTLSELTNAVAVPSQAVQTGQNGDYVFVVNGDQSVKMRPVKTGDTLQGLTVVLEGLKTGETVVTDGQLRLIDGTKVSAKSSLGGNDKSAKPADEP